MLPGAKKDPQIITSSWHKLQEPIDGVAVHEVRVAARSHIAPEVFHGRSVSPRNALLRGQVADVSVPPEDVRLLELRAREFSLHHVRLLHSSPPNPTGEWRVGVRGSLRRLPRPEPPWVR